MLPAAFRALRPHQWVKNAFVGVPFVFGDRLHSLRDLRSLVLSVCSFCAVASCIYLINDIRDRDADRIHPHKRHRPIASGALSVASAKRLILLLACVGLTLAYFLPKLFVAALACYFILNLAYTLKLKQLAYVDVLCIALGFEIRVLAGAAAAVVMPSLYLLGVTFSLASFLGFGKRYHELSKGVHAPRARSALRTYSISNLVGLLYLSAVVTLALYLLYTLDPETRQHFGTRRLYLTFPFAAYGMYRFVRLATADNIASPTDSMLRDKMFMLNLAAWLLCCGYLLLPAFA